MKSPTLLRPLRYVAVFLALAQPLMVAQAWALNPLDHGSSPSEPVPLPSPQAAVSRLLPEVTQPGKFELPDQPTDEDITRCGVFSEPLVPMADSSDREENAQLAAALQAYQVRRDKDAVSSLVNFCQGRPASRWLVGLEQNLGLIYYHQGYLSKALSSWEQAWELGKGVTGGPARALVNQSFAELVRMNARMGRVARLEQLLAEGDGRLFLGNAAQVLTDTKDALALMKLDPAHSFRCGPLALAEIRTSQRIFDEGDEKIREAESSSKGYSFVQVADLAKAAGMKYRLARRDIGASVITPAVVHWKVGHYAALIKQDHGKYLLKDLTVGSSTWLSQRVLDEEASGYFLVPQGELPMGWHAVPAAEVADIWGCWATSSREPGHQSPKDNDCGCPTNPSGSTGNGSGAPTGVPQYNVKAQSVSLTIFDVPVGYSPPVGPSPKFVVTYNQSADGQPATFTFFNLGQNWSTDWLAYVVDDPANGEADVQLFNRGGGYQTYSGYDAATQQYSLDLTTNTSLMKISDHAYERDFPDGSKEIYAQPNTVTGAGRQVFLTAVIDPQGNSLTLSYDGQFRLVGVKDAVGQTTKLTYGLSADPYKITAVTDPFGRTAHFGYTNFSGTYLLTSITDVIGLTSSFQYEGTFINAMTTPYGTTKFSHAENYGIDRTSRSLDAVDPLGGHQRTEFAQGMPTVPLSDPKIPAGMKLFNLYLNYSVTYFWDKHAMQVAPGDYTQAKSFNFVRSSNLQQTSGLIEATKNPLESRIWFNYPGQPNSETIKGITVGKPSLIGRILDDSGTTQLYQNSYNSLGNPTQLVDPKGRTTVLTYAPNGSDLVKVQQRNGSGFDTTFTASYNGQHLPVTVTDAAGQTTFFAYNAFGQPTSVVNAIGQTTRMVYDGAGRLLQVVDPQGQTAGTWTYDDNGRVRTYKNAEGYTIGYAYDALDRVIQVSYPDGTFEALAYTNLDLTQSKDRLGRATVYQYNPLRQMTAVTDPAGRVTTFAYCTCGVLDSVTDANRNVTQFLRDVQSRIKAKVYADNSEITYAYDLAGRLGSKADAKNQITGYQYDVDNRILSVQYAAPTPGVTFAYDVAYGRLSSMVDAIGTTTYVYIPAGQFGALQLATEQKPAGYGTITYSYDALGRQVVQSLDGVADTVTYDSLGRVVNEQNSLGSFEYAYVGETAKIQQVDNPNGQNFTFTYYGDAGSRRLQEILQTYVGGSMSAFVARLDSNASGLLRDGRVGRLTNAFVARHDSRTSRVLSDPPAGGSTSAFVARYDYVYNAVGDITAWSQQNPQTSQFSWNLGYDPVDQLGSVTVQGSTPVPIKGDGNYFYDMAGNLVQATSSLVTLSASYNSLNQLTQLRGTVGGASLSNSPTYDADGNLARQSVSLSLGDNNNGANNVGLSGPTTYQWDGVNRLTAVSYVPAGSNEVLGTTEFTYDGLDRLVRIIEKTGQTITDDRRFVWCGRAICQERDSQGNVFKRFFTQGFQVEAASVGSPTGQYYYGRDHLGSIRSLTDGTGLVRAVYEYDAYGVRQKVTGDVSADFGFTGLLYHGRSHLCLALYRAYDPALKRWLSRDPLPDTEMSQGPNLYDYVKNNPVDMTDPLGLAGGGGGNRNAAKCPCGQHRVFFFNDDRAAQTASIMTGGTGGVLWSGVAGTATRVVVISSATVDTLGLYAGLVALETLLSGMDSKCVPD